MPPFLDAQQSSYLRRCGYTVLRFWNDDVLQRTEAVLEQIGQEIERTRQSKGEKRSSDSLT
jgi:very-short-patch-repair endonuclease